MKQLPFFSIIIPSYNSEQTLQKCLESVINQTFSNIEILLMDGVSTDSTLEIAKSLNDSRIRLFSEKDNGIYDAMNKGIKLARGEWLYFLGSDDFLYNQNVLQEIFIFLDKKNIDVVYGNIFSPRFNGIYAGKFDYDKILHNNICHQAIFFNKILFEKTGYFNLKYKAMADYDHNLKWFLNNKMQHQYVDLVITYYNDGGYSSVTIDNTFLTDKNFNYIKYGFWSLPKVYLLDICKQEMQNTNSGRKRRLIVSLFFVLLRILNHNK